MHLAYVDGSSSPIVLLMWLLGMAPFLGWALLTVLTIGQVSRSELPTSRKFVWVLVALILPVLGSVIYWVAVDGALKPRQQPVVPLPRHDF